MKRCPVPQTWEARADEAKVLRIRPASITYGTDVIADAPFPAVRAFPVVPGGSEVVWVYAVTADADPARLRGLTGVAGEPVRLVTEGGLSAVVGSVSDSSFGERTLPSLLADLNAIEVAGRAHHRVISRVAGDGPVLPLRLATVYADDETVAALLARRYLELTVMLESFRGMQEWDVKVYLTPWQGACDHVGDEVPRWLTLENCADEVGRKLSRIAVATRRRPSPLPGLADRTGWVVLNSAYLVDTEHASRFSEIVESVTAAHTDLRAVVSGPWPPYSFADR